MHSTLNIGAGREREGRAMAAHAPFASTLRLQRQEDEVCEFEVSLVFIVSFRPGLY